MGQSVSKSALAAELVASVDNGAPTAAFMALARTIGMAVCESTRYGGVPRLTREAAYDAYVERVILHWRKVRPQGAFSLLNCWAITAIGQEVRKDARRKAAEEGSADGLRRDELAPEVAMASLRRAHERALCAYAAVALSAAVKRPLEEVLRRSCCGAVTGPTGETSLVYRMRSDGHGSCTYAFWAWEWIDHWACVLRGRGRWRMRLPLFQDDAGQRVTVEWVRATLGQTLCEAKQET